MNALRHREKAIEAMKRKIEAKMKSQGRQNSHDNIIAQQIAATIVDKNAESPIISPETPDIPPPNLNGSSNNNSILSSEINNPEFEEPPTAIHDEPVDHSPVDTVPDEASESDEEARILVELEAERRAEEQARFKRQLLEDRLRNARGKKRSTSAISEVGDHVKDSMSI